MQSLTAKAPEILLANFRATITHDVTYDDGWEEGNRLRILAVCLGESFSFEISPEEFYKTAWWLNHIGGRAVVCRDAHDEGCFRVAVQALSNDIKRVRIVRRLGWVCVDGSAAKFAHAGGLLDGDCSSQPADAAQAEGASPTVSTVANPSPCRKCREISVEIDPGRCLEGFVLPRRLEGQELTRGVRAALQTLRMARRHVTVPLFCAVWRAPLGDIDLMIHVFGGTGMGKSVTAAVYQQFYGSGMDARHLPANWHSTANSVEAIAAMAKDVLMVVDNWIPAMDPSRTSAFGRIAQSIGDRVGRARLGGDARLKQSRIPQALIVSTGEELPAGKSTLARLVAIPVEAGDVAWARLGNCQHQASSGTYASVMAAYLSWLSPRLERVRASMPQQLEKLRRVLAGPPALHARTPDNLAQLLLGLLWFLLFCAEKGALSGRRADKIYAGAIRKLQGLAEEQGALVSSADPAQRFVELLRSGFQGGLCHVLGAANEEFPGAYDWGWSKRRCHDGDLEMRPRGEGVGWLIGNDLYLDREAALRIVQKAASRCQPFAMTPIMLSKHLYAAGLLKSTELDNGRESYLVRVVICGTQRLVLHLDASKVIIPAQTQSNDVDLLGLLNL